MQIDVSFKQMSTSDSLRNYATEKTHKLDKYFDGKVHVTWNLTIEKISKIAHVHVIGNHLDYFAEGTSEDFMASIDQAIDKIVKQVKRHKEIVTAHH